MGTPRMPLGSAAFDFTAAETVSPSQKVFNNYADFCIMVLNHSFLYTGRICIIWVEMISISLGTAEGASLAVNSSN